MKRHFIAAITTVLLVGGCQNNGTGGGSIQPSGTGTEGRPGYIIHIGYTQPTGINAGLDENLQQTGLSAQFDMRSRPTILATTPNWTNNSNQDVNPQPVVVSAGSDGYGKPVGNTDFLFTIYTPDQILDHMNFDYTLHPMEEEQKPLSPQMLTVDSELDYRGTSGIQEFKVSSTRALDDHQGLVGQFGTLITPFGDDPKMEFVYDGISHPDSGSLIFFVQRKEEVAHQTNIEIKPRSDWLFNSVVGMTRNEDTYTLPQGTLNYSGLNMLQYSHPKYKPGGVHLIPLTLKRLNHEGPFTMQVNFDEGHGNFESRITKYSVASSPFEQRLGIGRYFGYLAVKESEVKELKGELTVDAETGRFVGEKIEAKIFDEGSYGSDSGLITNARLDGQFHGVNANNVIGVYKEDGSHNGHYSIFHGAIIGERVD